MTIECSSLAAALLSLAVAVPAMATPVELLSHRAAYRLTLASPSGAAGVTAVQGGLVMEWRAECDGWISSQRLGFVAATDGGPGFSYDVRFSSWESRDNTKLRFNVRSFDGLEMREEFRGEAALAGSGADGLARYDAPEGTKLDLPAGTIFPTEHVRRLIEAARSGERVVTHAVFDGSGEDALANVNAVIGPSRERTTATGTEARWPVNLAYYGTKVSDTLPDFQISFEMDDRGVLYDVMLDYGDFALKADLEKLEPMPAPDCR